MAKSKKGLIEEAKAIGLDYFKWQQQKSEADKHMKQDREAAFVIFDQLQGEGAATAIEIDDSLMFGREVKTEEVIDEAALKKTIGKKTWEDISDVEYSLNPMKHDLIIKLLQGAFPEETLKDLVLKKEVVSEERLRIAKESGRIKESTLEKCSVIQLGSPRIFARPKKDWIKDMNGNIPILTMEQAKEKS